MLLLNLSGVQSLYVAYLTAIIIYFRYVNIDMGGEKTSKYSEGTLSAFLENAFCTNVNMGSIGDDIETSLCLECLSTTILNIVFMSNSLACH